MKKRFVTFLFLLVLAVVFGCSDDSSSDNPSSPSDTSAKTEKTQKSTETAAKAVKGSGTIGTEGGKVKAGSAVTIKIPAEALKKDTKISVKYYEDNPSDSPSSLFLGEVEFGPSGTKFKKPAEVTMKLSRTPKNSTVSVFNYDEKNDIWDYVTEAEVSGNTVKFKVEHFSKYRTVDITPSVLNKYIDIVKAAKENKTSDKKITQKYADYLENDVKVMDSYVEQNDHLYKACGFRIDGAYFINGEEGNPNELSKQFGKSNKKGDTYGVSKIGNMFYSYADYVKKADGEKESQDCISITVTIDYELVEAYKISGHIEEQLQFDIDGIKGYSETLEQMSQREVEMKMHDKVEGAFELHVEYDFQGYLHVLDETTIMGTIKFTNADASVSSSKLRFEVSMRSKELICFEGQCYRGGGENSYEYGFFESFSVKNTDTPDYGVSGNLSKNKTKITIGGVLGDVVSINGKISLDATLGSIDGGSESFDTDCNIGITIDGSKPLLKFELKEGTKTYTSTEFKDQYSIVVNDLDANLGEGGIFENFETSNYKTSTKQTITVEYMPGEE